MTKRLHIIGFGVLALATIVAVAAPASAQITQRTGVPDAVANKQPPPPPGPPLPNYVIGPDDVLTVTVWNEKNVSGDVIVRPDGKITLPVGNDIFASGLTTEELKKKIVEELKKGFYDDPTVFIQVKAINSRKVCITGLVAKVGCHPLTGPMDVLELISISGGLLDFADAKNLVLVSGSLKAKDGTPMTFKINYKDMSKGVNLAKYNLSLRPGDKLIVK